MTGILEEINNEADAVVEILTQLSDFAVSDELQFLRDNTFTSEVNDVITQIEKGTDDAVEYYRLINLYSIPAIFFGCMILVGIILAVLNSEIKPFICFQAWVVLPLLYIFIFFTVIVTASVSLMLVANAGEFF